MLSVTTSSDSNKSTYSGSKLFLMCGFSFVILNLVLSEFCHAYPDKTTNAPKPCIYKVYLFLYIYIITIYSTFVILILLDPLIFLLSVSILSYKAPYPDKTDKTPKVPDAYVSEPIVLSR